MSDFAVSIPGYAALSEFVGGEFPSFHDSEVVAVSLNRAGVSRISIRFVGRRRDASTSEWIILEHFIVTFLLEAVTDLELQGFNHQNVIARLTLSLRESGIRLELWPCFGLAGWIDAEKVSIESGSQPL